MSLDLLFPHFDELIRTPADVERLNQAILQLAVQGKLVEQDPHDESASELLRQIALGKAQMGKSSVGSLLPLKPDPDSIPFELPNGWIWVQLKDAGIINPRNEAPDHVLASFVPMQMINDGIGGGHTSEERLWGEIRKGYTHFAEGDVGLAKITPCFQNRKSTVFNGLSNGIGAGTTELHIFRPVDETIVPEYILYFFQTPNFIYTGVERMTGTAGQQRIPKEYVEGALLPLPPLAEQRRIVAKVDELFAQTRLLAAHLRRAQEEILVINRAALHRLTTAQDDAAFRSASDTLATHFDQIYDEPRTVAELRQAILDLAVRGKLVEQDPNDEPASALSKRIVREKQRPLDRSLEPLYELPSTWIWTKFSSICEHRLGKMLDNQKNRGEYRPYLRNLNVQWDRIDFSDVQVMRFEPEEFDEYRLALGDLLICEGGEPGRCALWTQPNTEMMFQKAIHRARPYCGIISRYLLFHIWADAKKGQLTKLFTGATIQHFTGKALADYAVALPPLAEQQRIVAKVDQLLRLCDELEAKLQVGAAQGQRLTAAVLAQVSGCQ